MSERYSRLFSLPENLYTKGAPVIISAGALLKDNKTGNIIAQLKFQNIDKKTVKAIKVLVHQLDTVNQPVGEDIVQVYLDLEAGQGDEFGQKVPIALGHQSTRAFTAEVTWAVLEDNSVWEMSSERSCVQLPAAETLENKLKDPELTKQYRIRYGSDSKVVPQRYADLWQCKCGSWNRDDICWNCKTLHNSVMDIDLTSLKKDMDERVKKETEEKNKQIEVSQKAAIRNKKLIATGIAAVLVAVIGIAITTKVIVPSKKYNQAIKMMENGSYEDAFELFDELGNYKNSESLKLESSLEATYQNGEKQITEGRFEEAIETFNSISSYKDSVTRASEAREGFIKKISEYAERSLKATLEDTSYYSQIENKPAPESDFIYINDGKEVIITGYQGPGGYVVIPNEIEGVVVTQLADEAFRYAKAITGILIPPNLRYIGKQAFYGLNNLTGVLYLPSSLERIGGYAFQSTNIAGIIIRSDCTLMVNAFANNKSLEFIFVEDGCSPILKEAVFGYNERLQTAIFPSSISDIAEKNFKKCDSVVFYAPADSYAERYAKTNDLKVETDLYDGYYRAYREILLKNTD